MVERQPDARTLGPAGRDRMIDGVINGMIDGVIESEKLSDREHFEAVVGRYQSSLLRYARSSLCEHDAQDVVQETFLRLHKTMAQNGLRDIGNLGTWLFRVAHNCAADVHRKRSIDDRARETVVKDSNAESCAPSGLEEVVRREDCRLAFKLLDTLPAQQKQVLLLKVSHGMTYRQICEVTSLPLGTVGYLMNQGLGRLARELKSAGAI